jgi:hypothetical protein
MAKAEQAKVVELNSLSSVSDLEAAEFDFAEEVVEVPTKTKPLKLRFRQLDVGRRSALMTGLTDGDGNVTDVYEVQVRTLAATCVEPPLTNEQVRRFLKSWPSAVVDKLLEVSNRLGGNEEEVTAKLADEFPEEG